MSCSLYFAVHEYVKSLKGCTELIDRLAGDADAPVRYSAKSSITCWCVTDLACMELIWTGCIAVSSIYCAKLHEVGLISWCYWNAYQTGLVISVSPSLRALHCKHCKSFKQQISLTNELLDVNIWPSSRLVCLGFVICMMLSGEMFDWAFLYPWLWQWTD